MIAHELEVSEDIADHTFGDKIDAHSAKEFCSPGNLVFLRPLRKQGVTNIALLGHRIPLDAYHSDRRAARFY